jgi:hypothetical protein
VFNLDFHDFGWSQDKFDGETVSYVLTDILERFPKQQEVIKLEIFSREMDDEKKSIKLVREFLEFKVLGIEDANI